MNAHVVVVGAGPVGATSALLLAERGVGVTLLERNDRITTESHASTFHPSTLDLLTTLGIGLADDPRAVRVDALQWRDHTGSLLGVVGYDLVADLTAHPFRIHLDQQVLLDRLAEAIAAHPAIELRTGCEVVAADLPRRELTVEHRDGRRAVVRGDRIVAADGSHSTVRHHAGLHLPVRGYPTAALRAYARADLAELLPVGAERPLSGLCYFRGGGDGVSALRMRRDTRLIVRSRKDAPAHERVAAAVARATPWTMGDLAVHHIDEYRLGRGVIESYLGADGVLLVVGDAAHVTSTAGGLNMNSGLHDAFALMPVLADELSAGRDGRRLRVAAARRRDFVLHQVIPRSERRVRGLQDTDGRALAQHLDDVATLHRDPSSARRFLLEASLLDTDAFTPHRTPTHRTVEVS